MLNTGGVHPTHFTIRLLKDLGTPVLHDQPPRFHLRISRALAVGPAVLDVSTLACRREI